MEKYGRVGRPQMTTTHERSMLDKQDYKHKLRICDTYYSYFSAAAMVARTRLVVRYTFFLQENDEIAPG
jgi:hypothetical protein